MNKKLIAAMLVAGLISLLVLWQRGKSDVPAISGAQHKASKVTGPQVAGARGARVAIAAGVVVSETDGVPVARATVCIVAASRLGRCEQTDGDGRFRIEASMARGDIIASALGHRSRRLSDVALSDSLRITLGAGRYTISGHAMDAESGPLGSATIRFYPAMDEPSARTLVSAAMSDAAGLYQASLAPGYYVAEASFQGYVSQLQRVHIAATHQALDFRLMPGGSIEGVVSAADGSGPVEGVTLIANTEGVAGVPSAPLTTQSGARGRFRIEGLRAGRYELRAIGRSVASRRGASVSLALGESVTGVELVLDRAYSLAGTVVRKGGKQVPVANVRCIAVHNLTGRQHGALLTTNDDGRFRIDGLFRGRYELLVHSAKSGVARVGQETIVDHDVTDVRLEYEVGVAVRGHVRPAAAARITLQPVLESLTVGNVLSALMARAAQVTEANSDGEFMLTEVPRGRWTVSAEAEDGTSGNAEITVAQADLDIGIDLEASARIVGKITDSKGGPVSDVVVRISPYKGPDTMGIRALRLLTRKTNTDGVPTDTDGRFESGPMEPGVYWISVHDRVGFVWIPNNNDFTAGLVEALPGQEVTMNLTVDARDGVIRGRVVDTVGAPVADVRVTATLAARMLSNGSRQNLDGPGKQPAVLTNSEGGFSIDGLREGLYRVSVYRPSTGARTTTKALAVGTTDAEIVLESAGTIDVSAATASPGGCTVVAVGPTRVQRDAPASDCRVSLGALAVGTYRIEVRTKSGVGNSTVTLRAGGHESTVVQLDDYARIIGVLKDAGGAPVAGAWLVALSDSPTDQAGALELFVGSGARAPHTNSSGHFSIDRVLPGEGGPLRRSARWR